MIFYLEYVARPSKKNLSWTRGYLSHMAIPIDRLHCVQLPSVAILGVGKDPRIYLAHAQQVISCLLIAQPKRAISTSLSTYLKSEAGKKITMGGDLKSACSTGPLTQMMYTHKLGSNGGGSPSIFLTVEGVRCMLRDLPNQDDLARRRFCAIFEDCVQHMSLLNPATAEQCLNDHECEETADEIVTDGYTSPRGQELSVVTERQWYEARLQCIKSHANSKILEADMAKERVEMAAALAREQSDKERLQQKLAFFEEQAAKDARAKDLEQKIALMEEKDRMIKEAHAKDLELMKLRMDLERANERISTTQNKKRSSDDSDVFQQNQENADKSKKNAAPSTSRMARTSSLEPIPYAISSSPLLELSPFNDDPQKARICHKVRKYRWLITYSAESALNETDFEVDVTRVISIACGDGNWMSLTSLKDKLRLSQVISIVEELSSGGRIKGPVAIEVVHGGTHRFKTAAVHEGDLAGGVVKSYVSQSPSLMYEGGEAFFKMRTLF
jgi:hypothetical protein